MTFCFLLIFVYNYMYTCIVYVGPCEKPYIAPLHLELVPRPLSTLAQYNQIEAALFLRRAA